jgi:uncharacterized protein (TIGR02757 family)
MQAPKSASARADAARRVILDDIHRRHHVPELVATDPLAFARRHDDPADQEVAALIAASFAFGNVKALMAALEVLFRELGPQPATTLAEREPRDWARRLPAFSYRWVRAADARVYLAWIGAALREHGSLGALWAKLDDPAQRDTMPTLAAWIEAITSAPTPGLRARGRTLRRADGAASALPSGAHLLLTSPAGKSACKRMNLFLRWVCRPDDGVDLGLWPVSPARLLLPLDTHLLAAASLLGFTQRTVADLRTVREVTDGFRRVCPEDPCRYDFALTRLGILRLREQLNDLAEQSRALRP